MPDWKKSNSIHDTEVMEVGRYRLTVSPTGAEEPAPTHQWEIDLNNEHGGGDLDWEPTESMETAKAEAVAALEKHLIDTLFELLGITGPGVVHFDKSPKVVAYPPMPKYRKGDRVCFLDPADQKTYTVESHYTFDGLEWLYDIQDNEQVLTSVTTSVKEKELFPVENCVGSPELDALVEQAVADVENGDTVELP